MTKILNAYLKILHSGKKMLVKNMTLYRMNPIVLYYS